MEQRKFLEQYGHKLKILDGVIMFTTTDAELEIEHDVAVVPQTLRPDLMKFEHEALWSGHSGPQKTLEAIRKNFWWPKMSSEIRKFCELCDICQRKNSPKVKTMTAPLRPIEPCERFNYRVHMDLMGGLTTRDDSGFRYILVICDAFTKWVELVPLKSKTATEVSRAFVEHWIMRHGSPKQLASDQGLEFNNKVINYIKKIFQIDHIKTAPYNPKSNGQCERVNRSLQSYLQSYIGNNPYDWVEWLPAAQMGHNASIHRSTEFTPFFALYGREMELPDDIRRSELNEGPEINFRRIQLTWNIIRRNLLKASAHYKLYYDRRTTPRTFEKNQLVLLKKPRLSHGANYKFMPVWSGPYRILNVFGQEDVSIEVNGKPKVINVNQLKPYKGNPEIHVDRRHLQLIEDEQEAGNYAEGSAPVESTISGESSEYLGSNPIRFEEDRDVIHAELCRNNTFRYASAQLTNDKQDNNDNKTPSSVTNETDNGSKKYSSSERSKSTTSSKSKEASASSTQKSSNNNESTENSTSRKSSPFSNGSQSHKSTASSTVTTDSSLGSKKPSENPTPKNPQSESGSDHSKSDSSENSFTKDTQHTEENINPDPEPSTSGLDQSTSTVDDYETANEEEDEGANTTLQGSDVEYYLDGPDPEWLKQLESGPSIKDRLRKIRKAPSYLDDFIWKRKPKKK